MCNNELNEKENFLKKIRMQINICFNGDGVFSLNPTDEDRVRNLIKKAIEYNLVNELKEIAVFHFVNEYKGVNDFTSKIYKIVNTIEKFNDNK